MVGCGVVGCGLVAWGVVWCGVVGCGCGAYFSFEIFVGENLVYFCSIILKSFQLLGGTIFFS